MYLVMDCGNKATLIASSQRPDSGWDAAIQVMYEAYITWKIHGVMTSEFSGSLDLLSLVCQ
jgi:hypothetical protein